MANAEGGAWGSGKGSTVREKEREEADEEDKV